MSVFNTKGFDGIMGTFKLSAKFKPTAAQEQALSELYELFQAGAPYVTLLGVTGSGKTFVMALLIERLGLPTLVISPNKVLAAQLFSELKEFFPENAVEFFISYYDFYRPEAYIPERDLYLRKEAEINETINALRHRATSAILTRQDTIVVASVSCIYNIGKPDEYWNSFIHLRVGEEYELDHLLSQLVKLQYDGSSFDMQPGSFRYRGNTLQVYPPQGESVVVLEFDDELLERITLRDKFGRLIGKLEEVYIPPATHFQVDPSNLERAISSIEEELRERVEELRAQGKLLEAERLERRTKKDILDLKLKGYCHGIENYWRHLANLPPGTPPWTLLDYFRYAYGDDMLVIVDESHITVPQIRGMYKGDRRRKEVLIEHGFRLPSCLDNRPLRFEEFLERVPRMLMVSATPGQWELSSGQKVELLVRPTGIVDPEVEVIPREGSFETILSIARENAEKGDRTLIVALTQRMAEDIAEMLKLNGIMAEYLHAGVEPLDRIRILKDFRKGKYKVLVGVNLLREGLDLPEVSTVIILDADVQGFLRSKTSLIQIAGRAARHMAGKVVLVSDTISPAMKEAIEEMRRRREFQLRYNEEHGIKPKPVRSELRDPMEILGLSSEVDPIWEWVEGLTEEKIIKMQIGELKVLRDELRSLMKALSKELEFERAAMVRDKLFLVERVMKVKV